MDLRDLLTVLRARWMFIVAAALVGAVFGLVVSLMTSPKYEASVQFYTTTAAGEGASSAYQGSLGAQQKVQSYAELVNSRDLAEQVVEATGVDLTPQQVIAATGAIADPKTVLLSVNVTDSQPERALQLAEGFGEVLPEVVATLETPDEGGPALAKLTVVNPPALPSATVAPKTEQNVGIGMLLGLLIGVAGALLVNALDRRLKENGQIEQIASTSVVGAIPFRNNEDKEKDSEHLVPFREGHSPAAEAFRRLRTNLEFLNVDNPPRTIVLTSSVSMEGKSETAVNLSLALAESGNQVLLIEADLRRPRVVNYMSMPDTVGLTNILSGQASFDDVVQETRYEGVDLLACGPLPPNPSELLASEASHNLIASLRERYDYILIDSPPLLPVTDGALLARITDGALVIVRSHRTTSDQLAQAVDNLAKADAKLLGVVAIANKPQRKSSAAYAERYYYPSRAEPVVGQEKK